MSGTQIQKNAGYFHKKKLYKYKIHPAKYQNTEPNVELDSVGNVLEMIIG